MEYVFDNSERIENLSYAVGYYRKKAGLSQEQLAEILGISRRTLQRKLKQDPSLEEGVPPESP